MDVWDYQFIGGFIKMKINVNHKKPSGQLPDHGAFIAYSDPFNVFFVLNDRVYFIGETGFLTESMWSRKEWETNSIRTTPIIPVEIERIEVTPK